VSLRIKILDTGIDAILQVLDLVLDLAPRGLLDSDLGADIGELCLEVLEAGILLAWLSEIELLLDFVLFTPRIVSPEPFSLR
jgi:hypothetical protein